MKNDLTGTWSHNEKNKQKLDLNAEKRHRIHLHVYIDFLFMVILLNYLVDFDNKESSKKRLTKGYSH